MSGQRHRAGNVGVLGALVATAQQPNDHGAGLDEIHPVTRPVVDAEFTDTLANGFDIAQMPEL